MLRCNWTSSRPPGLTNKTLQFLRNRDQDSRSCTCPFKCMAAPSARLSPPETKLVEVAAYIHLLAQASYSYKFLAQLAIPRLCLSHWRGPVHSKASDNRSNTAGHINHRPRGSPASLRTAVTAAPFRPSLEIPWNPIRFMSSGCIFGSMSVLRHEMKQKPDGMGQQGGKGRSCHTAVTEEDSSIRAGR
jgi:hypothetical protein